MNFPHKFFYLSITWGCLHEVFSEYVLREESHIIIRKLYCHRCDTTIVYLIAIDSYTYSEKNNNIFLTAKNSRDYSKTSRNFYAGEEDCNGQTVLHSSILSTGTRDILSLFIYLVTRPGIYPGYT